MEKKQNEQRGEKKGDWCLSLPAAAASFFHFKPVVRSEPPACSRSTLAVWQSCVCWRYTNSVAHHAVYVVRKLQLE